MGTWATPVDVEARWASNAPLPDADIIQAWLDDAEMLVFAEIPDLADRVTNDATGQWQKRLIFVEVQLASQALRNPDGVRQHSFTSGEFTNSTTFGSETISQFMQLTPAHRALLSVGGGRHVGIDMTVPEPEVDPLEGVWVNGPAGYTPGGAR